MARQMNPSNDVAQLMPMRSYILRAVSTIHVDESPEWYNTNGRTKSGAQPPKAFRMRPFAAIALAPFRGP